VEGEFHFLALPAVVIIVDVLWFGKVVVIEIGY
jgi:hypothetical protein